MCYPRKVRAGDKITHIDSDYVYNGFNPFKRYNISADGRTFHIETVNINITVQFCHHMYILYEANIGLIRKMLKT